jgi:Transposase DDE domain
MPKLNTLWSRQDWRGRGGMGKATPSFKSHRSVDDQEGVITAVGTTGGAVDEATQLFPLLDQSAENTGRAASAVVADSRYGHTANFIALARRGVRAHVADLRSRQNNHRAAGIYPAESFSYDATRDLFTCPAGQSLKRHHFHHGRGYHEYRAARGVCAGCELRGQCTRGKAGRTLNRYAGQGLLDLARSQSHSEAGRRDRRRRQWLLEGSFGRAATQHGFKRARWRGLKRQGIQDHLIATVQNLLILIGRRRTPPLAAQAAHAPVPAPVYAANPALCAVSRRPARRSCAINRLFVHRRRISPPLPSIVSTILPSPSTRPKNALWATAR